MSQNVSKAVIASIEALLQPEEVKFWYFEKTFRQLREDLENANLAVPEDLNYYIEESAIAVAENRAYGEDPCFYFDDEPEDYLELQEPDELPF